MRTGTVPLEGDVALYTSTRDGVTIEAALPKGDTIDATVVNTMKDGDDQVVGHSMGAIFEGGEGQESIPGVRSFDRASKKAHREACRTIWLDLPDIANDLKNYDCYQKFRANSKDWAYNRYTLTQLPEDQGRIWNFDLREVTLRFRESKRHQNRIKGGPWSYGPTEGNGCRDKAGYTVSLPVVGVSIPVKSCDDITPLPGGKRHATGTRWEGVAERQRFAESFARYHTNGSEPIFSDYLWVESCQWDNRHWCKLGGRRVHRKWTDSNWS